MKLSNKGQYAVRALFDIEFYNDGEPTQVRDIATRQGIPPRFLEQIFQDLKRAKIVASKRGPRGGYRLATDAESIRLGDVIRATEGPVDLGAGSDRADDRQREARDSRRVIDGAFKDLSRSVQECFDAVTVQDLCARAKQLQIARPGGRAHVYVI